MNHTIPAPDPYQVAAEAIHDLADQLATLAGRGLTAPHINIGIQPFGPYGSDEESEATRVTVVDAVAEALGMVPEVRPMSSGAYHRDAERVWEHGRVAVYTSVVPDEVRELRRRLAEAEAELAERYKTRNVIENPPAGLELEQAAIPAEAMTRLVQPEPVHDPAEVEA